jgi:hypothetical protein
MYDSVFTQNSVVQSPHLEFVTLMLHNIICLIDFIVSN